MAALGSERTCFLLVLILIVSVSERMMTVRSESIPSSDVHSEELTWNGSTKILQGPRSTRDLTPAVRRDATGGIRSSEEVKDIWLLGLFPMKGSWAGGLGQLPAVQLGIKHVNEDPNILAGYRLRMTVNDTEVRLPAWISLSTTHAIA